MSDQEEEILRAAKSWKVPESRSKADIWGELEKKITKDEVSGPKHTIKRSWVAAAIVLVTLGLVYQLFWQTTVIETGVAESKNITLPDGSRVTLNAESRLSFHSSSFKKKRLVDFEGEGFFEVEPGEPFVVNLNGMKVNVLGTSFNIYSRDQFSEVKCLTGKVEVKNDDKAVLLEPGKFITSDQGQIEAKPVDFDLEDAISWQRGKFLFTNAPLTRVVKELEIQYGVKVIANGLEKRFYTGYFDNTDLEKAVRHIFSPMGYTYEIKDKEILIQ